MATNNGNGTVTVVAGDTLWSIASTFYRTYQYANANTYMDYLVDINNLKDPNVIIVGEVLKLTKTATTGGVSNKTSKSVKRVTITRFGLISNDSDSLYVAWNWDKADKTEKYLVRWYRSWDLKGIAPFVEQEVSNPLLMYDSYSPPSEVVNSSTGKVAVSIKPVSKTYKSTGPSGTQVNMYYFTSEFTTITDDVRYYYGKRAPTDAPNSPSVKIEDTTLTATLDDIPDDYTQVDFQICRLNGQYIVESWKLTEPPINVFANTATYTLKVDLGYEFKVRCRYVNDNGPGEWSGWSEACGTKPSAPLGITTCRAITKTEVFLEWELTNNADSYDIEYTTNVDHFDTSSNVSTINGIEGTKYFVTDLESGDEYFFRVRAVNQNGESGWTKPVSIIIGTTPAAPRTWSSTTTVISGEELTLYWYHNSEDESTQTKAEVEMTINGTTTTETIETPDVYGEENDDKRMYYTLSTTGFAEGATILWRVRTAGATGEYGDWSIQRTVTVYAQPTLSLSMPSKLTSFPLKITGVTGPTTQTPVGYHISIISNSYYETVDKIGNEISVSAGDEVYSNYIDTSEQLDITLSAADMDVQNNMVYAVTVIASMDSGLVAEDIRRFTVSWTDEQHEPNAEIGYDSAKYTMLIRPYCRDEGDNLVDDITLSVYRREYNGTFTEIMTGLDNAVQTYITDPHPSLDYARYRVVATSNTTGAVSYTDLPAHYIGESAIIIQWDDVWRNFDTTDEMEDKPAWSGSLLRLPYNIDVSEAFDIDVSLVEYIGREHPVSYYGTQRGETATWNVEIPKSDTETLYALRRLATWMGNVYVREPSGTGYWARVKPSFNQKHKALVIPITLNVTRVEGGA